MVKRVAAYLSFWEEGALAALPECVQESGWFAGV